MEKGNDLLKQRYRILMPLGEGGFSQTFLVSDLDSQTQAPPHNRYVAKQIKLRSSHSLRQLDQAYFEREVKTLYRLGQHNQIPHLLDHFEENGELYLIQEFIDGHDLKAELPRGHQWSEADTLRLIQEILEVLVFVHQDHVIHRDLKPANIMRRHSDGKIVLIDFGSVKELPHRFSDGTELTMALGTPGYTPIEQAAGKPKLSSDIFAVGMIGIQALTGVPARELPEDPSTAELIWKNQVSVSPELSQFLSRMVRAHFQQRYANAAMALQALLQIQTGL